MAGIKFSQATKKGVSRWKPKNLARRAKCAAVSRRIYQVEVGESKMPAGLTRHSSSCLVCQAASSRQRQVLHGLSALRNVTEPYPYNLVIDDQGVLDLPESTPAPSSRLRAAVVSAVSMVVAVGAIGIAWAGHRFRAQAG